MSTPTLTLPHLIRRFWRLTAPTWVLVLLESAFLVAVPLVIGWAVDDLVEGRLRGLVELAALCVLLLVVGAGRRFYDTRAYARIYRIVSWELVAREKRRGAELSRIAARTGLFGELIDFLEESIPELLQQVVGLIGSLVIIALIDVDVFLMCLAGLAFTTAVYGLSEGKIFRLNAGANGELERQVEVLESGSAPEIRRHFKQLMGWRIRLSDLETLNFSAIWVGLALLLVASVALISSAGDVRVGSIVSMVMYVLGFIESVLVLPLYFQQWVRLQEIGNRLASPDTPGDRSPQEIDE
ncbi:MAG: ABC transporter six-transmembrane domain-containing protein [Acidobacteriota bacterium]